MRANKTARKRRDQLHRPGTENACIVLSIRDKLSGFIKRHRFLYANTVCVAHSNFVVFGTFPFVLTPFVLLHVEPIALFFFSVGNQSPELDGRQDCRSWTIGAEKKKWQSCDATTSTVVQRDRHVLVLQQCILALTSFEHRCIWSSIAVKRSGTYAFAKHFVHSGAPFFKISTFLCLANCLTYSHSGSIVCERQMKNTTNIVKWLPKGRNTAYTVFTTYVHFFEHDRHHHRRRCRWKHRGRRKQLQQKTTTPCRQIVYKDFGGKCVCLFFAHREILY